jgi:uncharacterized protein (DUF1501 family)
MSATSRRAFLQHAASLSTWGAAAPLGLSLSAMTEAAAQSSSSCGTGYKALVCIFMYGGNDAYNTVLATDATSWQHYLNHRNPKLRNPADTSQSIALMAPGTAANLTLDSNLPERLGGVLPISQTRQSGRTVALHPSLTQIQSMHQAGNAAVLANVGPLLRPTTKADWANAGIKKPAKLFSHNDQQATWQSFSPEGATAGWGGRMGDLLMGCNGTGSVVNVEIIRRLFTCMTPTSGAVWLAGSQVQPYQSGATGVLDMGANQVVYGSARLYSALSKIMGSAQSNSLLVQDHQKVVKNAFAARSLLSAMPALGNTPWSTAGITDPYSDPLLKYPGASGTGPRFNSLAQQLQMVARLIETNRAGGLGITRQLFMVSLNGFDTHDRQIVLHADAMNQLNSAMVYFDQLLANMPGGDMRAQVTTFTASEFGRTFTNNGDGTDHGWGGHHFIMGGAVKGTEVYGSLPEYSTANASTGAFSSVNQIQNGAMLPTTSVDQYAYTLGKWLGVSHSDLLGILPNLSQFNSSTYDLGFMKA